MTVAGVLLAAGAGRRFGMPKALVRHHGSLLVEHAAAVLRTAGCTPVLVVLGASAAEVRATARLPEVSIVDNPQWSTGMGSSLRLALAQLHGTEARAAIVLPVDTPGVTPAAVERLAALATADALARATYDGQPGHPVLLGRTHWHAIAEQATGDAGARDYLATHHPTAVPCEDIATGQDADRPEDLPR